MGIGTENIASVDAYNIKPKERVGSEAFNLEYEQSYTDAELRDDIVSYLGEYRLKVPKFEYELSYGRVGHEVGVRDVHQGELMRIKASRSISERQVAGKPVHREVAEEKGLRFLESQLEISRSGDTILWGSPPGPKDQGYGEYGFVFYGQVREVGHDKKIKMKAIRVEKPSVVQYSAFFDEFVESPVDFSHADQYLASPFVILATIPEKLVDSALKKHFDFEIENEDQGVFEHVINDMSPMIDEFIELCRIGTSAEKLRAFNALENYALMLRDKYRTKVESGGKVVFADDYRQEERRLQDIVGDFGHKPPSVGGSCGSSESSNSIKDLTTSLFSKSRQELMRKLGISLDDEEEEYSFNKKAECVVCHETKNCGPCDMCKSCDIATRRKNGDIVPDYILFAT